MAQQKIVFKNEEGRSVVKIGRRGMPLPETLADVAAILKADEGTLRYVLNHMEKHCYPKTITSRSGKERPGFVATPLLKGYHKRLLAWMYGYSCHKAAHGWRPGRSTVSCAQPHVNRGVVLKFDIADFFPNISPARVRASLEHLGSGKEAAAVITKLATVRGQLPQGFSTSPMLANLVFIKVDARIWNFCEKVRYEYTRYGDDLTISGRVRSRQYVEQMIRYVLDDSGFVVNATKFAERGVQQAYERQQILGINVNDELSVPAHQRERCERMIEEYIRELSTATTADKEKMDEMRARIDGLTSYIKQVSPRQGYHLRSKMRNLLPPPVA